MRLSSTPESSHLPQQFTSFIGRERELMEVGRRLADPACRLLTLVGPGGIGKTRLALQATAAAVPSFLDGTFFVNLQSVHTEELLLSAIVDALEISLSGSASPREQIHAHLVGKRILLTLDNFEQLLDAVSLLSELLTGTQVKFLVTSRETLNLQEEWLYPLGGMGFPTKKFSPDELKNYSAMQLFADRAQRVRPDFSLDSEIESVARICQLVEGMPLALELAASWVKNMSCAEIADEIERNRDFLSTRLHNIPERHRSLQAVFAQTWDGLDEQEQAVFQRLAVFRDGFLRDAAEAVAGASLSLLSSLLDKSLLRWEASQDGNGRYQIHELLRQYAGEKLSAQSEVAGETQAQHARYYAAFLDQRLDGLLGGRQKEALLEIEAELNNIRAAWRWAVEHEEWETINRAMESLHLFCDMQGRHLEGAALFEMASEQLSAAVDIETRPILGRLLCRYRFLQVFAPSPPEEMEADLNESLSIAREQDDPLETAITLMALGGFTFYVKSDPVTAMMFFEESLPLFRSQNHGLYEARALGWMSVAHPQPEGLLRYSQESLAVARAHNDKIDVLPCLSNLAEALLGLGDYVNAEAYCDEAIITADEMNLRAISAHIRTLLSLVCFLRGEQETAEQLAKEGLVRSRKVNMGMAIAYAEARVGLHESTSGNYMEGRQLGEKSAKNPANHGLGLVLANWGLAVACCGLQVENAAWKAIWEGVRHAQDEESTAMVLWLLPVMAVLLHRQGKSDTAADLLALASSHPLSPTGWMGRWDLLRKTRNELNQEIQNAILQAESMSLEDVLAKIKALHPPRSTDAPLADPVELANQALIDPLTKRELEVLQLIADGLSNREIADKFVISTGTVKYYTSQIYRKLQVTSRTQAVTQAREMGILQ